jgi:hypothetical protein
MAKSPRKPDDSLVLTGGCCGFVLGGLAGLGVGFLKYGFVAGSDSASFVPLGLGLCVLFSRRNT